MTFANGEAQGMTVGLSHDVSFDPFQSVLS
jgi:hypothetical protein